MLARVLTGATVLLAAGTAEAQKDPHNDPASLNARLAELHELHPKTTKLVTITTTTKGDVMALELDPDGAFDADGPVLYVQGGVHGSEWISVEAVLRLAELASDPSLFPYKGLTYRFVPAVNAEGFAKGTRTATDADGNKYDPNREFPVPEQEDHASRPLIQAIRDYVSKGNIVAVLDYHSAAECILWPYAYSRSAQPKGVEALIEVTKAMALPMGYCTGQVAKVISYKHQGTAADWYQDELGAPTLLVELAGVDDPGSQTADQILIAQERPFMLFVEWVLARLGRDAEQATAKTTKDSNQDCATTTVSLGTGDLGYTASGPVCRGKRHGTWIYKYLTGETMREGEFVDGLEHGEWRTYYTDGSKQDVGSYVDGNPDGTWLRYAKSGTKTLERSYDNGIRDGTLKRWTDAGKLWQVRSCRDGACATKCKAKGERYCVIDEDGRVALSPEPRKCRGKRGSCSSTTRRARPRPR
jgi:hypothetical protein